MVINKKEMSDGNFQPQHCHSEQSITPAQFKRSPCKEGGDSPKQQNSGRSHDFTCYFKYVHCEQFHAWMQDRPKQRCEKELVAMATASLLLEVPGTQ
jgi:hypothetical protein